LRGNFPAGEKDGKGQGRQGEKKARQGTEKLGEKRTPAGEEFLVTALCSFMTQNHCTT